MRLEVGPAGDIGRKRKLEEKEAVPVDGSGMAVVGPERTVGGIRDVNVDEHEGAIVLRVRELLFGRSDSERTDTHLERHIEDLGAMDKRVALGTP
jgi:hypothetical protein